MRLEKRKLKVRQQPKLSLFWHEYPKASPQPHRTILLYKHPSTTRPYDPGSFYVGYMDDSKYPAFFELHSDPRKEIRATQTFFENLKS